MFCQFGIRRCKASISTYVCDAEGGQVVAFEFAAHPLSCCARAALSQMRRHVASTRTP
jgi:hypothetical protein